MWDPQKSYFKNKNVIFYDLINRRKKGEPVAYLINKKEFWKEIWKFFKNKWEKN